MNKLLYFCFLIGGLLSCGSSSNQSQPTIKSVLFVEWKNSGLQWEDYWTHRHIENCVIKQGFSDHGGAQIKFERYGDRIVELHITNVPYAAFAEELCYLGGLEKLTLVNTRIENLSLLEPLSSSLKELTLSREYLLDDTLVLSDKWKNLERLSILGHGFKQIIFPRKNKLRLLSLRQNSKYHVTHQLDSSFWYLKDLEILILHLDLHQPFILKDLEMFPKIDSVSISHMSKIN